MIDRKKSNLVQAGRAGRRAAGIVNLLLTSTALMAQPVLAADNLPTGGTVAAGSVSIGTSGNTTTVTQSSDTAIVNWQGFSVGHGASVNFAQPGTSSAILNRVTGAATSTIAGSITANGQVYLINPNGIAITSTGSIKVGGGFVGSTLDMTDKDFLNGKLNFNGNGASAGVSNEGVITVGRGGYAALIGGTVKNNGLIAAPLGKIGLGAGEQATLDLSGDGFLQVALPTKDGVEGDGALIENSGTLSADGGTVVMKAATARNAARHAINLTGVVEANSLSGQDGAITLGGGEGGTVTVSGKVRATASTGKGGKITVTGKAIALKGASVDASGATGGGTVLIGGLKHGAAGLQTAKTTAVDTASTIRADATQSGNGGQVVVWSDDLTTYDGLITARGANTGTGGDAEVSGKAVLSYTGFTNLSGPGGFGTLLLDPYNITISSGSASNSSGVTATGNDSVINVGTLTTALAGANVEVSTGSSGSQDGDITVASDFSWSANTTLTLNAANNINIAANITATGESAGLVLSYGIDYSILSGKSVTLSGDSATLSMNSKAYTLIHSLADLQASNDSGNGTYFALAQNLDLSSSSFTDAVVPKFGGTLAGLGHTISNMTIDASDDSIGLIGTNNGTIRDLGIVGGSVKGARGVGGLVGYNNGAISNAYATGAVTCSEYVGGLVGYNHYGTISNAYATGTVTGGGHYVGGLVGYNYEGTISNAYATGTVTGGGDRVGGLVGWNSGTISNAYATGALTGWGHYVGGLVGWNTGTITTSYWDTQATGRANGDGNGSSTGVTGKTTEEMKNPFTFIAAGWDFEKVWGKSTTGANGGYIMLRSLASGLYDDYVRIGDTSKTYGSANPSTSDITLSGAGYSNVTLGWNSKIDKSTDAGDYNYSTGNVITVTAGSGRSAFVDYGTGKLTVKKAALTVTADNASKTSGQTAALTYTFTSGSLFNNDKLTGALASDGAASTAAAGSYSITQGTLLASLNYKLNFVSGLLTVKAVPTTSTPASTSTTQATSTPASTSTTQATSTPASTSTVTTQPIASVQVNNPTVAPINLIPTVGQQVVTYNAGSDVIGGGMTTQDTRLSNALCFTDSNFAISCSAN